MNSHELQGGGVLVEEKALAHDGRNVALGVDGVVVDSGSGLVVGEGDLLAV